MRDETSCIDMGRGAPAGGHDVRVETGAVTPPAPAILDACADHALRSAAAPHFEAIARAHQDADRDLPPSLMEVLRSTRRAAKERLAAEDGPIARRFAALVIGDDVDAQLAARRKDGNGDVLQTWRLGGAFAGRLRVRGEPHGADQARFEDLDLGAMRAAQREEAAARYDSAAARPDAAAALGVDLSLSKADFIERRAGPHPLLCAAIVKAGAWRRLTPEAGATAAAAWVRDFDALLSEMSPSDLVSIVECAE